MIVLMNRSINFGLRFIKLMALVVLHTSFTPPHPVHLTEAEAHWKKKERTLEISVKLFYNDLELSLRQASVEPVYLCPDSANQHLAKVKKYFEQCFKLMVNDEKRQFELLGYECENELVYVYLQYTGIKRIKNISLENTLLFDDFPDQTNLLNLHIKGISNTLLTKPKSTTARLDL